MYTKRANLIHARPDGGGLCSLCWVTVLTRVPHRLHTVRCCMKHCGTAKGSEILLCTVHADVIHHTERYKCETLNANHQHMFGVWKGSIILYASPIESLIFNIRCRAASEFIICTVCTLRAAGGKTFVSEGGKYEESFIMQMLWWCRRNGKVCVSSSPDNWCFNNSNCFFISSRWNWKPFESSSHLQLFLSSKQPTKRRRCYPFITSYCHM